MMLLMALSWFVYGDDIRRMDAGDYSTRAAAYSRLKAAGVWAVPALKAGQRNGTPERHMRIELILNSRASWWQWVVRGVLVTEKVTDPQLMTVVKVMLDSPAHAAYVYDAVDLSKAFRNPSSRHWSYLQPYITGSLETEIAMMLRDTRTKLLAHHKSWWLR
jgi:hypothetical protein